MIYQYRTLVPYLGIVWIALVLFDWSWQNFGSHLSVFWVWRCHGDVQIITIAWIRWKHLGLILSLGLWWIWAWKIGLRFANALNYGFLCIFVWLAFHSTGKKKLEFIWVVEYLHVSEIYTLLAFVDEQGRHLGVIRALIVEAGWILRRLLFVVTFDVTRDDDRIRLIL